jgi:hypothetical protein
MCKTIGVTKPSIVAHPEGAAVSTQSILEWVISVTSKLLPSQSATLAALVAAAVRTEWLNLASIGRKMAGEVAAKHTIKRAWRFTCNRRVEVHQAMIGVVKKLTGKRKKPLIVSFDWTDVRDFHTLMAAACIGGRAVPPLWASYSGASPVRSQNSLEERLLRKLRGLISESVPVTILADRGFGRAEWAAVCRELKFRHVVRIKPDVTISCSRYRGVLRRYPTRKGMAHLLKDVDYRKDKRVRHNIVIRWRPDLPRKRDEPWFLMTDLDHKAKRTCLLYGRRMSIENSHFQCPSRRSLSRAA